MMRNRSVVTARGLLSATHRYTASAGAEDATWHIAAGEKVQTLWVEMKSE